MSFKIFWANELKAGYKKIGTFDIPIITQKFGYIHVEVSCIFFTRRVAWEIK